MRGGMHGTGLDARAATRARRAAVRLNLGCGPNVAPGWLNVDLQAVPGAVRGDLSAGLPLADASVDCIAAIHLLQDLPWPDIAPALAEMRRVLRPGGRLLVLEFSRIWEPLKPLYDAYSFKVLPWLGKQVVNDADAYRYLAESIRMHPGQEDLKRMMEQAGFERVEYFNLAAGAVALHRGYRF
jgi:ubiquinone/menaquinone biosynthesis C-methylase UbiE